MTCLFLLQCLETRYTVSGTYSRTRFRQTSSFYIKQNAKIQSSMYTANSTHCFQNGGIQGGFTGSTPPPNEPKLQNNGTKFNANPPNPTPQKILVMPLVLNNKVLSLGTISFCKHITLLLRQRQKIFHIAHHCRQAGLTTAAFDSPQEPTNPAHPPDLQPEMKSMVSKSIQTSDKWSNCITCPSKLSFTVPVQRLSA